MDTDQVGVLRNSMKNNPLTIKPILGKTKSRGLCYPGPDFVYGAVTTFQDGGVAEAISSWHTPSLSSTSSAHHRKAERDFVALNREGVKSGLVTVKELQQYYATHNIRRPVASKDLRCRSVSARIPQDITFGLATRPSTPISALMEYRYAQKWLEEQQAKDRALLAAQNKKVQLGRIQDTRTTLLRKNRPQEEVPSMWKLPRFQQLIEAMFAVFEESINHVTKVGPALDTFRDPEARKKAMAAHYMDSVGRRGLLGQGTAN